eukprot:scaffold49403_cov63-Attheya_sp.AAC.1
MDVAADEDDATPTTSASTERKCSVYECTVYRLWTMDGTVKCQCFIQHYSEGCKATDLRRAPLV